MGQDSNVLQGNPELVPDHPAQAGIVFHPRKPDFGADFFSDGEQFLLGGAHADLIVKIQPSQRVQHITAQLIFDPVQLFGSDPVQDGLDLRLVVPHQGQFQPDRIKVPLTVHGRLLTKVG